MSVTIADVQENVAGYQHIVLWTQVCVWVYCSFVVFTVLLHLAEETIIQDVGLGLSYLLALPNVSTRLC